METDERHAYVYGGISWDAFVNWGYKKVMEDPNLTYYIHQHRYELHTAVPKGCNEGCRIMTSTPQGPVLEPVLPVAVQSVVSSSEGE